ncbi:hypothetical protein FRC04_010549, partial [Tulasnella sp. 424]
MSDHSGPSVPPEPEKPLTTEESRFESIRIHVPDHLLPPSVPNPISNLSTAANEFLAQLHQQTEGGKPLSDALAAGLFKRELSGKFGPYPVSFFQQSLLRISKNRKYGYAIGSNPFALAEPSKSEDVKFLVFVLSSAAGGNRALGVYRRCDATLVDLTQEEPFYRDLPEETKSSFKHGSIPCTALVFDSFDDQTQTKVRQETVIALPDSDPAQDLQDRHQELYGDLLEHCGKLHPVPDEGRPEEAEGELGNPNE